MSCRTVIFCESTYKVPFFTHNSQQKLITSINYWSTIKTMSDGLQTIGQWPSEPTNTKVDAFRFPRRCGGHQINWCGHWKGLGRGTNIGGCGAQLLLPHKMWLLKGDDTTNTTRPLRNDSLLNNQEVGACLGHNNQPWVEETERGISHNNYSSSPRPIRGHRQPVLPPNTTINSSHICSLLQMNGGRNHFQ
jgi:hypothetical protein